MKVCLLTDAKRANLALMKLSAFWKEEGAEVFLNEPLQEVDLTIGSYLFKHSGKFKCDVVGGPGIDPEVRLGPAIDKQFPDYSLYPSVDYSLGYTWEYCPNHCSFCVVPRMNTSQTHRSISTFHNPQFRKICLLNNNTFSDPEWKETFEEIWSLDLTVVDENGYDLRLLDESKVLALEKTRFKGSIHFAWDRMKDREKCIKGLALLKEYGLGVTNNVVYVLIGYDTTVEEDLYRCQVIHDYGLSIYPMPYVRNIYTRTFKRFINLYYYREYPSIKEAWSQYTPTFSRKENVRWFIRLGTLCLDLFVFHQSPLTT